VDRVIDGELDNAFVAVRPPGHHAERERAMGFCLFNNVAVAARHLTSAHGLQRVMIVDWDVHHGNGTQHIFYDDPGVLFVSLHQHPLYPGTGLTTETGTGVGEGFTINVPLPSGLGDNDYLAVVDRIVVPAARRFAPEFILVSAGFDAHRRDPLAGMRVTEQGFDEMSRRLLGAARESAGGKLVAVLEGGYDLRALVDSTAVVIRRFHEPQSPTPLESEPALETTAVCDRVCELHGERWGLVGA
jgi:acetoin utilization deacetylase AcuC-like enzyme